MMLSEFCSTLFRSDFFGSDIMFHYYLLLAVYIFIFTAANMIVFVFTYLFAAISNAVLKRTVKRVEMNPVEMTYAALKEYPDVLADFILNKTKQFKRAAIIYFCITEFVDGLLLVLLKDTVFPCRLSIGLMAVSIVVLCIVARKYINDVDELNQRVNMEIEYIKSACGIDRDETDEDTEGYESPDRENEIADGKAFLSSVVQNQLADEKLPDDFFGV